MAATVVKEVMVELRGRSDKLDAELKALETRLAATKVKVEGFTAAGGQAGLQYGRAATRIAGATETIARTGEVAGGAAKQIISAGSSIAFALGPTGAAVGAAGIFALAMGAAFGRASEEAKKAEEEIQERTRRITETLNRFDELDAKAQQKALDRVRKGSRFVGAPGADLTPGGLEARGLDRLRPELVALRKEYERLKKAEDDFNDGIRDDNTVRLAVLAKQELPTLREQVDAYTGAISDLERVEAAYAGTVGETVKSEEDAAVATERRKAIIEGFARATRETTRVLAEFDKDSADFGRNFNRFVLQELGSAADQVAAKFDDLIAQGTRTAGASDPRVKQLEAMKVAAVEAALAIERTRATLEDLDLQAATGTPATVHTFEELSTRIDDLRRSLVGLAKGSAQYRDVEQQILKIEQARSKLLEGVADAGKGKDGGERPTALIARDLQQAVDGALQLGAAMGLVSEESTKALRAIAQIAGGIPSLRSAITKGGGLGIVGAALPIAGALASLFGESPEEAARKEELRKNTDAIRELTKRAGALGLGISGADASGASAAVRALLSQRGIGNLDKVGGRLDLGGVSTFLSSRFGVTLSEVEKIAAELGITLSDDVESWRQLDEALNKTITKLGEFGTELESARAQANAEIDIFGITDPLQKLAIRTGAVAGRSSAFDALTAGLDLSTAEGREQARKNAQALFEIMKAGGGALDASQLGGLTGDELLDAILELVRSLNEVDESLGTTTSTGLQPDRIVTSDRTQITADQASRLLGLESSQLTELRLIRQALTASVTPISLPSAAVFSAAPTASSIVINLQQEVNFLGPVTDGQAATEQIVRDLVRQISRELGLRVTIARQNAGKAVIT